MKKTLFNVVFILGWMTCGAVLLHLAMKGSWVSLSIYGCAVAIAVVGLSRRFTLDD